MPRTVLPDYLVYHGGTASLAGLNIMSIGIKLLTAIILCLLLAAGCGQKGPLYLPGNPSEIRTDIPPQEQADREEEENDNEDTGNP